MSILTFTRKSSLSGILDKLLAGNLNKLITTNSSIRMRLISDLKYSRCHISTKVKRKPEIRFSFYQINFDLSGQSWSIFSFYWIVLAKRAHQAFKRIGTQFFFEWWMYPCKDPYSKEHIQTHNSQKHIWEVDVPRVSRHLLVLTEVFLWLAHVL